MAFLSHEIKAHKCDGIVSSRSRNFDRSPISPSFGFRWGSHSITPCLCLLLSFVFLLESVYGLLSRTFKGRTCFLQEGFFVSPLFIQFRLPKEFFLKTILFHVNHVLSSSLYPLRYVRGLSYFPSGP